MNVYLLRVCFFIYLVLVSIFVLLFGFAYGIFVGFQSCLEEFVVVTRQDIREWKRYPKRHYEKFIHNAWLHHPDHSHLLQDIQMNAIKQSKPSAPFPFLSILGNMFFCFFLFPFLRCTQGFIEVPIRMFTRAVWYWDERVLKKDPYGDYLRGLYESLEKREKLYFR